MLDVIVYDTIEKKNQMKNEVKVAMTSQESLIQCLNLMDFLAALNMRPAHREDHDLPWIILNNIQSENQSK